MGTGKPTAAAGTLELFSTCPQSKDLPADEYRRRVADVAAWSDRAGYRGILVYTDNQLVDPWLVAEVVIESAARQSRR
jgi:alkanesulfonate monooxygenase